MTDRIFGAWLDAQYEEAMTFSLRSDVVSLAPVEALPPTKYIAEFRCRGLERTAQGIVVAKRHVVGINLPADYLRTGCGAAAVLTWLEPAGAFHPNISPPFCCVGHIPPGMSLVALLHQLFQMITWQRFTPREDDALNLAACSWARNHMDRLPVDARRSMLPEGTPASTPQDGDARHV